MQIFLIQTQVPIVQVGGETAQPPAGKQIQAWQLQLPAAEALPYTCKVL